MKMHDWSLLSVAVGWKTGEIEIGLSAPGGPTSIRAEGLQDLRIPRAYPWGPSISINEVRGPTAQPDGLARVEIEMQSGDLIEIIARSFRMPEQPETP